MSAAAIAQAVRNRALSAQDVLESVLRRLEKTGPSINAFRIVTLDRARREAAAIDSAIAAGRDPGPLAGVPYGVKDLFDVQGLPTAAGSKINLGAAPAQEDGILVQRMHDAGAVLLGVQIMDEYAYGFTTENAHYGAVRNPHDLSRSAGGSSGGSAAAVAAGLGAFSLASDTNGSIRVPSSFCGLFGLKPTFGRLPRTGSFPFVFDIDHLGPIARSAEDLALIYDALQGWNSGDPGCVNRPAEPLLDNLANAPDGSRIAILSGWFEDMAGPEARAAVQVVAQALDATDRVALDGAEQARSAAYLITVASGANLHRENLRNRPGDFDAATRGRLLAGALVTADAVLQAQRVRRRVYDEAMAIFRRYDVLLAPTTPFAAPLLGQPSIELNGQMMSARPNIGVLTQPLSCIGLPVVSAPIAQEGLPIGVQIIAPPWREDIALQCAAKLEAAGIAAAKVIDPC